MKAILLEGERAVGKDKSTFSHQSRGPVSVATVFRALVVINLGQTKVRLSLITASDNCFKIY